jgi:membrane protein required for beta-lactamase induction
MLFIATLLGLALQAFTNNGFTWHSPSFWAGYLRPFQGWAWFLARSLWIQCVLLFAPLIVLVWVTWPFFQGLLWGFGALLFYVICFGLCCDGYRFIDSLGRFADPAFGSLGVQVSADDEGTKQLVTPVRLYQQLYGKAAPGTAVALRDAILVDALTHLVLYLFTPLFWFVCLGPLAGLVVALSLAIATSTDSGSILRARLSTWLHWVSWLPARLFSLSMFFIQRGTDTTLRQWWSLVKLLAQEVPDAMRVTAQLSILDAFPVERGVVTEQRWPSALFGEAQALCQRVVMLWLGVIALFTVLL